MSKITLSSWSLSQKKNDELMLLWIITNNYSKNLLNTCHGNKFNTYLLNIIHIILIYALSSYPWYFSHIRCLLARWYVHFRVGKIALIDGTNDAAPSENFCGEFMTTWSDFTFLNTSLFTDLLTRSIGSFPWWRSSLNCLSDLIGKMVPANNFKTKRDLN